jgi:hypothetical protein
MTNRIFAAAFFSTLFLYGQGQVLIQDNYSDRSKFIDNTLLTLWGTNLTPSTGFDLGPRSDVNGVTFNALSLNPGGIANSGYTGANSLKTLTSIDYVLPLVINRLTDTIIIEFDAIWQATSSSGENGRLVVTLMDNYPAGGAMFGQVDNIALPDPFGRPLYNIRIRNNTSSGNGPLMLYGAGTTLQPEWEKYGSGPWWLPGFSVQAGGGSPGTGPNYPQSGTMKDAISIVSTTRWRHYTWKIFPERMELYSRNYGQPASADILSMFMQIPRNISPAYVQGEILAAHGISAIPPNYDWFQNVNAVRFYWRGVQNLFLANVEIRRSIATTLPFRSVTAFNARKEGSSIRLSGQIEAADDRYTVSMEHSRDGRDFRKLETLSSVHLKEGRLWYLHQKPFDGINYYRLLFEGPDSKNFSAPVVLRLSPDLSIRLYPNPNHGSFKLDIPAGSPVFVKIWNSKGVLQMNQRIIAGKEINFGRTAGHYYYKLYRVDEILKTGSFIVQ